MKNLASCWLLILLLIFQTNTQGQTTGQKSQLNVAILIFDGVQMIDYTGPYEAFSGVMGGEAQFKVYTVAEKPDAVKTNSGMSINPQFSFKDVPQSDIVVIPGGITRNVLSNPTMLKWVQDEAQKAKITMSVCTGAFILAKAGLLDGLQATTTAGHTEGLKKWAPKARVVDDKRFVDAGRIVTTAGGTSSIDGALHVIEKVFGKGTAQMTALNMEYDWEPDPTWVRSTLADKYMQFVYSVKHDDGGWKSLSREGTSSWWVNEWELITSISAAEILSSVNAAIAEGKTYGEMPVKWVRLNDKRTDANQSAWQFTDEAGGRWKGVVSVEVMKGSPNHFVLSVKVARDNSASRRLVKRNV